MFYLFVIEGLFIITRVFFLSKYLYDWDAVQYALALKRFSIPLHQPHPPGYIFFVGLGKLFYYLLKDANIAYLCSNFLFGGLTLVFLYLFAKKAFSNLTGLIVCGLFLFNPIFWFYGEVTSSYLVEACFSTLLAYLSYRLLQISKKDNMLYILAFLLGISGGFRQDIPFFMLPLCLYAALSYTKSVRKLLLFAFIFCISVSVWYIPTLFLSGGYSTYSSLCRSLFLGMAGRSSIVLGAPLINHIAMLLSLMRWSIIGFGPFLLLLPWALRRGLSITKSQIVFFSLWILPSFMFFTLIYIAKPGYTLIYLPGIYLLFGYVIEILWRSCRRWLFVTGLISLVSLECVYFLFVSPLDRTRHLFLELPFSQKTLYQNTITQLNWLCLLTRGYIVQREAVLTSFIQAVKNLTYPHDNITIVVYDSSPLDWRRIMYYLPDYRVFYIGVASKMVFLAFHRSPVPLPPEIKFNGWIIWAISPVSKSFHHLCNQTLLQPLANDLPPIFFISKEDGLPLTRLLP